MITKEQILNTIFFDIETTTRYETYEQFKEAEPFIAKDFDYRSSLKYPGQDPAFVYGEFGMLYPEIAQVVSIAAMCYNAETKKFESHIFGFDSWDDYQESAGMRADRDILINFNVFLEAVRVDNSHNRNLTLGGYRIKSFDVPFLFKRMLANGIYPDDLLNNIGKKPWEVNYLDLYDYWNVGMNGMSGFGIICELMGVSNPKTDAIDGKNVCHRFWQDHDVAMINEYCARDTKSSVQLAWNFRTDVFNERYVKLLTELSQQEADRIEETEQIVD